MSKIVVAQTAEQVEQVRGLFREYHAELPFQYCFASFHAEVAGLPGEYGFPKGRLLLATVAGQPVGCVALRPHSLPDTCEMKRLFVRPTFRGRNLGNELVEHILSEARVLGYSRLRLDTHPPTMQAAIVTYRKMGFQEIDPDPKSAVEGLLYMELSLKYGQLSSSSVTGEAVQDSVPAGPS